MTAIFEETAMVLCLVAYCPVCEYPVRLLPGGQHWRCVEIPKHRDKVGCPRCGTTFDTDGAALNMKPVEVEP